MSVLCGLNEEQLDAVTSIEGYVRVIAGAGSGKTRALSHRFAYLVNEAGILPSNIMCVTFTNKAANEMKQRIRKLISDNDCGYVSTFHGFCVSFLKEECHYINYPQNFIMLDEEDTDAILNDIYAEQKYSLRECSFKDARDYIRYSKHIEHTDYYKHLISLDITEIKTLYDSETDVKGKIFFGYVYYQRKMFALDFCDLIILTSYILASNEEIRLKWQKRLQYIMVDEFQDIDLSQYELVKTLSNYYNNLFIVGDPDQTIYSWRGANVYFINNFDKDFPNVKTIFLNKNYRSTSNILCVSNSLIEKNKNRIPKELIPLKNDDIPVIYNHTKTSKLEAEWIVEQINLLINSGNKYNDIAILYRAHYVSRPIEECLIKNNIKYTLYSGIQFYNRKEIKDILSYMRLIVFQDDLSFKRVVNEPKRNIGKAKMEILLKHSSEKSCSLYQALKDNADTDNFKKTDATKFIAVIEKYISTYKDMSLSELLSSLLNDTGYEEYLRTNGEQDRLDNLAEFKHSLYEFEVSFGEDVSLGEYLTRIALYTNTDVGSTNETVKLMTIHTAKGLEFPYVFVCGMSEGIFPSKHVKKREGMEEERRLAYVAFTRAENALFISDSEGKNFNGSYRYPSRFIFNIEKKHLSYTVELDDNLVSEASYEIEKSESDMDFDPNNLDINTGDRINNKVFGNGTILEVNLDEMLYIIKFDNIDTERKINLKSKLTKLKDESENDTNKKSC